MVKLAPICLFVYNRPQHLLKTLSALLKAKLSEQSEIFIFCDGMRLDDDPLRIEEVRSIVQDINGFKKIHYEFSEHNKGLGKSIIYGVSKVLEMYESVIVLEDDHLVHEDFLVYMNFYLENFKYEKRIMHIGAFQRNSYLQFFLPKTYFTRYMDCWGWATWAESWKLLILDFQLFENYFSISYNEKKYNFNKLDHHLYLNKNKDEIITWAIFWHSTIAVYNGLCLMSKYSYVKNIGNDGTGSNQVVKTNELASNFIKNFIPYFPVLKETKLTELYIQDAYAKRSRKRFTTVKNWLHILLSKLRNIILKPQL